MRPTTSRGCRALSRKQHLSRAAALGAAVLAAIASPATGGAEPQKQPVNRSERAALRTYVAVMGAHMRTFRAVSKSGEAAFSVDPSEIGAFTIALRAAGGDFAKLAADVLRVRPPRRLAPAHRKLVESLRASSAGFSMLADAWSEYTQTGDFGLLQLRTADAVAEYQRAQVLHNAWMAAVRASVRRAGIPVAGWLRR